MKNPLYRKNLMATLSVKPAKAGLRQMLRKQKTLHVGHAFIGLGAETGEVIETLTPFICGASQLNSELKQKARPEFGDVFYYTYLAAKFLKVKVPSSTKKVRLKGMTITEALLKLSADGSDFVGMYHKMYYGLAIDEEKAKAKLEAFISLLWGIVYTLYNEPPAAILEENIAKLAQKYPGQVFSTEAALAQEQKEAAEASQSAEPQS